MEPSSSSNAIPINTLISFHSQERILFKRLVFEMEINYILAMAIIAFWMWLESIGHPSFIQHIVTLSDDSIRGIVDEGATYLTTILFDAANPFVVAAKRDVLTTSKVKDSPIELQYFYSFWGSARDGVTSILENICPQIFRDLIDSTSSRSMLPDRGETKRLEIEEGKDILRAYNNPQLKNEGGILGPYNRGRSRMDLDNQSRVPTDGGIVMSLRKGTPIRSYGEGTIRGPYLPLQLPFDREGNTTTREYQEMFTSERWHLFNMLGMRQEIQSNYMHMLLNQSFRIPNHHFNGELNMGGLSISPSTITLTGGVANQALASSDCVASVASLSPYFLMHLKSSLNPMAQTCPSVERDIPHDERTLFITFSNGYPLGERDLFEFFNRHYGGIEGIHIQEVDPDLQPLFARVVFYLQATCLLVLNGNEKAKFMIKGKHVWARRYVPKKKRKVHQRQRH